MIFASELSRARHYSRIFVFDDWVSRQNFFKQFFSGIFIVIVMTGLTTADGGETPLIDNIARYIAGRYG